MNSHTKPRHENKQDLIYLLPVSRQMPGQAGSTAGRGGMGNCCGRILAWEDQEGSIPLTPCTSPCEGCRAAPHARILHTPAAPCNVPQHPPGAGVHRTGTVTAGAGPELPGPRLAALRDSRVRPAPGRAGGLAPSIAHALDRWLPWHHAGTDTTPPAAPELPGSLPGQALEIAGWRGFGPTL